MELHFYRLKITCAEFCARKKIESYLLLLPSQRKIKTENKQKKKTENIKKKSMARKNWLAARDSRLRLVGSHVSSSCV